MKKILFFAATAFFLTLTSFKTISTQDPGSISSHECYEDAGCFYNDCAGEMMDYCGQVNFDIHGVVNGDQVSYNAHLNYQGLSATGQISGVTYRGNGEQNITQNNNFRGAGEYTAVTHIKFTAPGKKNNIVIKMLYHYTINANGEVSSTSNNAEYGSCQ